MQLVAVLGEYLQLRETLESVFMNCLQKIVRRGESLERAKGDEIVGVQGQGV